MPVLGRSPTVRTCDDDIFGVGGDDRVGSSLRLVHHRGAGGGVLESWRRRRKRIASRPGCGATAWT